MNEKIRKGRRLLSLLLVLTLCLTLMPTAVLADETLSADSEVSTYTVSITLPEAGVTTAEDSGELTQNVSAESAMADIRLVSTYEDEPFESDMAELFNARLFENTGLTASFGDDSVITIGGTPAADVAVNLADAFAEDEPATVADTSAIYVSKEGSDTDGDGSQDKPYATISKAYTVAATGDTIYLLSDVDVSTQISFSTAKTVTITSADSSDIKTIYSKVTFGVETRWLFNVNNGHIIFKNITIDGEGQINGGTYYAPGAIVASKGSGANSATVTIDYGTTIRNFKKTGGNSGGAAVVKSGNAGAVVNIKDGVMITGCVLETGNTTDPASVISSGTGAILYMTGGNITGNTLSTTQDRTTAVVNIGMVSNPHFWMTGGKITGNTINKGCAAVYMRGEANACDMQFGDTAYVYDNYVNGTSGEQRNIYLKNDQNGKENDNVFVKLCSTLTDTAKLGVYAEKIGMGTKVAQGGGINDNPYTATAADATYFVSDKETGAEILYCGGDDTTCGLLQHDTNHNSKTAAIYLSVSPAVTAEKSSNNSDLIDLSITRCTDEATYVVLDKDLKPVTGKDLTGGAYADDGNGTFKLSNTDTTTTIGMPALEKDKGPYTVMLVSGTLSLGTDGKANTDNLTDIATVNIVNFAGDGVTWSNGATEFVNGDFDVVIVPHNDQTGKATKTYTATAETGYAFAADGAITVTGNLGELTATKETDAEKYNVSVTVPAYGTTEKGTSGYNTVTLKGATGLNTGVKLKNTADADSADMTVENGVTSKVYDGAAVAYSEGNVDGATLSYTWQKKDTDSDGYTDIGDNAAPSDAGDYNLKITATKTDGSTVLGTENLPFTISKKALTVTATVKDKTYDGKTDATLKSASLSGVLNADKSAVTLDEEDITVTFADKNAGDSKAVTATVSGGALTGDKAGNYEIKTATAENAKISPATVTATIKAENKEYDGSETAEVETKLTGMVDGDNVTAKVSNAVFVGGSGVDNNKTVTVDIALEGDDADNYKLQKDTASAKANITAKELSVTVSASNKAYDGTTKAEATVELAEDSGIIAGDAVTLDSSNMKAAFDTAAVGDKKTVTITGLKLYGTGAKNYKLPDSITGEANITQAKSGVGTVTIDGWTYGETANSPVANSTTNPGSESNPITYQYKLTSAEDNTYTDTVPTDAGEYTVKATFPANTNYNETTATANFTISKKELTATVTAQDKTYDGTNTAEVTKVELAGMVSGETVTATASDAKFAGVNARNDQTVTATITLSGDKAKNYTVAETATTTASITAKTLTVIVNAENKKYDGTTKATILSVTISGQVDGDTVALNKSSMTAVFDNANVGDGKTVTVSGLALDNNDNGNYKLPNTITGKADIKSPGSGVGNVSISGWTYGETANSPVANSTTNPETDTNKISYQYKLTSAEDNAWTETVPTDAGEYTVKATFPANTNYNETTATANFTIIKKALTVDVTAADKGYDGTTTATLNTAKLTGVEKADTDKITLVEDGVSAAFNNKNVGTDKSVTLSGSYTLTGDAAKNYTVTTPTGLKASITAAPLTISGATVTAKTYDGDDDATVTDVTFDGLKKDDSLKPNVDYTVYNAKYNGVNATDKGAATKAEFNVVLTNTNAAKNYVLSTTAGSQSATIGKADHSDSTVTTEGNRGATNTFSGLSAYVVAGGTVGTITTSDNDIIDETPTYDSSTGKLTYKLKSDAQNGQTATVTLPVTSTNYEDYNIVVTVGVTPKETVEIGIERENYTYDGAAHAPAKITVEDNKVLVSALKVTYKSEDGTTYPESKTAPTNAGMYIMTVKVPDSNTTYTGSATCAFEITKKSITATITAEDKTYDGNTTAEVTPTLNGVVEGDSGKVTANVTAPVFANKNVGENKTVTASISLTGDVAGNYKLQKDTASATANITAKELSVTVSANNKAYDGKTDATATVMLDATGIITDDAVTLDSSNMKAAFDTAAVGDKKTVTVTGLKLDGTGAKNYKLPESITGEANITKAKSGIGTVTIDGWTYGEAAKTPVATSTTNPETATDKISYQYKLTSAEDNAWTATVPTDAGEYTVKATFPASDNYGAATATADFTISPKALTATITAKDKTYDGTDTAEVTKVELAGMVNGETVTATASDAKFAGVNVRNDQTVTATITLDSSDAAKNYTVAKTATTTAGITAKTLTVNVQVDNKTYDGKTDATATVTLDTTGIITGETVTLDSSDMKANFADAEVNDGKTVTITGLKLSGDEAKNYKLPDSITGTANITKAESGVGTVTLDGWTYGETANSPVATSTTNPETDTNKISYQYKLTSAEDNAWMATVPTDAGKYTVKATFPASDNYGATTATADFTISKKALTVDVTAADKKYDGTATATLNTATLTGVEKADTDKITLVEDGVSAAFNNKNVGTDKSVTLSGSYTLSGDAAKNYTVTTPTSLKANITAAPLAITGAIVMAKTYDGNDDATVNGVTFDGLKKDDSLKPNVDYTVYNAKYDGVNVTGTGAATKANFNVVLTNTDAAKNYVLSTTAGSQSATIGKANHSDNTVTTEGNRGKTNTFSGLSAYVVAGGTVGTVATAGEDIFDETPTYGDGKLTYKLRSTATENQTATVTLPVTSANYNDYNIVVTVGVTPKETVEIGIERENYTYDGATHAPAKITVAGNKVLVGTLEVTYKSEDGTTYPESTTAPTNAGKYIMTVKVPDGNTTYTGSATCAFEITKKSITATITAEDKTYDGNTTAEVTPTLNGVVEGDSGKVTANVTAPVFANKNVGENKTVTASISLTGDAADNYSVNAEAETKASISVKEVTITGVTVEDSKIYDRNTTATVTNNGTINGKVETDDLTVTGGTATYADANVGENKTVTFAGFALTGTDADNYRLTGQPESVKASITAKELTITGATVEPTKVYDGNASAEITNYGELNDVVDGDTVTIKTGTAAYDNENAGENKTVTFSGFALEGADAGNYTLKSQPASITASISKKELTVTPKDVRVNRGITPTFELSYDGLVGEENVTIAEPTYTLKDSSDNDITLENAIQTAGTYTVKVSGDLSGDSKDNYEYKSGTGTLTVKRPSSGGGSHSGSSGTTGSKFEIPVSGDKTEIRIEGEIDGKTVVVSEVTDKDIETVGEDENVVIELEELNKDINSAKLTVGTLENVLASEAKGLEVKLPNAIVTIDRTTLKALTEQAIDDLQLVVEPDEAARKTLNSAQKESVSELVRPTIIEAFFTSFGNRIGDFKGGEVSVSVPFYTDKPIRAWYLKEDGTREKVGAVYDKVHATLTLTHFSHYAIEELENEDYNVTYASCPKDTTCPIEPFPDAVNKEWYHDGCHFCIDNGLMVGFPDGNFYPYGEVTRAQVVTILWRLEGSPVANYAMNFADVPDGKWFTEAIRWAASEKLVDGYSDTAFGSNDAITREQFASILWRYSKLKGYDVSVGEDTNILDYDDAPSISSYAVAAMQWACGSGMISGVTSDTLVPGGVTSRAQAATMFMRYCAEIVK